MQIVCNQCQAEYEIDAPAAPFGRVQDLVFRCSACGHSIPIRADQGGSDAAAEAAEEPAPSGYVLRQNGQRYQVDDAAMLQRWIAERRVWVDDEISIDGGDFCKVGDLKEFEIFFQLVSDAERSTAAQSSAVAPTEVPEPANVPVLPEGELSSRSAQAKGRSLFARPTELVKKSSTGSSNDGQPNPSPEERPAAPVVEPVDAIVEGLDPSDDETALMDEPDAPVEEVVVEEDVSFGEAVPDEDPGSFGSLQPDEPTMDMELEEEDFFSEETTSLSVQSMGLDDDDDLEWGQTRRSNMLVWWLLFLGGLGGSGYLALEWLNQADEAKNTATAEEPSSDAVGDGIAAEAEVPEDSEVVEGADSPAPEQGDDGAEPTPEVNEATAGDAEGVNPDATGDAETAPAKAAEASKAAPTKPESPKATPAKTAAKPAPPAPARKPSPGRESDRGWGQIDRGNWDAARKHFNAALSVSPSYPDAQLGLAYVNEHQGRVAEAVRQYCRLAATGSGDVKNEANGRLRSLDKECP